LAEGPDGVYLIDQHAAHERVLYEDLRQRMLSRRVEAQTLLVPVSVELTPEHARTLERLGETLADAGFSLEPFGEGAVLLRAVPQMLASSDAGAPGEALLRILDEVGEGGSAEAWRERLLHAVACHSAVRAGRRMTVEESRELVQRLERTPQPHTCPHGRPTMVHLSAGALEREFRRS
ncbi:MAG: DNA mismatch repair protein MutL, partial [Gemmatimonadetes bacterium]|nr:DNA mismatch repair protein MutL [Gemmatimonadota bacterium]